MKILFCLDTLANAGTEKSILQTLPLFTDDLKYKVVYFYPKHDLEPGYQKAKIPLEFLNLNGKYNFLTGVWKLRQLVELEKPDLLVSSLLRSNLMARIVSLITGVPLIGTFVSDSYNNYQLEIKNGIQQWKFKFFWYLDKITAGIPKVYIANSAFIANSHIKTLGVPLSKTIVIYRGREVSKKSWTHKNISKFRFLAYGRLLQIKGFEELIKAFDQVHQLYPNTELVIYGEGIYRRNLENLLGKLELINAVKLPGVKKEVSNELYMANCFVFPSWYEGFSGALVEAMMAGIPIIASDIPMNLEAVQDKETALVFPVRNIVSLVEKMIYAIDHPEEMAEIGRRAREVAIERFDIEKIAKQYEAVLWKVYHTHRKKS